MLNGPSIILGGWEALCLWKTQEYRVDKAEAGHHWVFLQRVQSGPWKRFASGSGKDFALTTCAIRTIYGILLLFGMSIRSQNLIAHITT